MVCQMEILHRDVLPTSAEVCLDAAASGQDGGHDPKVGLDGRRTLEDGQDGHSVPKDGQDGRRAHAADFLHV